MIINRSVIAGGLFVVAFSVLGCKGIDEKRKEYATSLESKVPEGCKVKPSAAAIDFDCKDSKDQAAAAEAVQKLVKDECSKLGELKISSVVLSAGKAGYFQGYETAKGDCTLTKK
ncbi:MAG: hypothetical protein HOV80_17530 [Polyangiaceae bacterium]|nr:hypothetical protein [Polyangiaceae bacterium]